MNVIESVDADGLARIAGEILGGSCCVDYDLESSYPEHDYIFVPNLHYGGCFGGIKKATHDLFQDPDQMDAWVTGMVLKLMHEKRINLNEFPYIAINKDCQIWAFSCQPELTSGGLFLCRGSSVLVKSCAGRMSFIIEYSDELHYMHDSIFKFNPDA